MFIVIFGLRARRMSQMRPLKLERLWIVPAIYLVLVAANFVVKPPTPAAWRGVGCGVAGRRGARLAAWPADADQCRSRTRTTLSQKGSPLAILFLLAIIGVKIGGAGRGTRRSGFDVALVTDAALAFALGMFTMTRIEMYLRAKRLLDEQRGSAYSLIACRVICAAARPARARRCTARSR